MKRSELKRGPGPQRKAPLRRTGFGTRGDRPRSSLRRSNGFAASTAQRVKVRDLGCVVCGEERPDPHHLIDRSLTSEGQDDPLAVVPLCRNCHRRHHDEGTSILEYLEPRYRLEVAFAVERVGLLMALQKITGERWEPA